MVNAACLGEWECLAVSFVVTWLLSGCRREGGAVPQPVCHVDSAAAAAAAEATQTVRTLRQRRAVRTRCCTDGCVPFLTPWHPQTHICRRFFLLPRSQLCGAARTLKVSSSNRVCFSIFDHSECFCVFSNSISVLMKFCRIQTCFCRFYSC